MARLIMGTLPRYYENDLQLINADKASLQNVLTEFREAVRSSVQLITSEVAPPTENDDFGTIYNGDLGNLVQLPGEGSRIKNFM